MHRMGQAGNSWVVRRLVVRWLVLEAVVEAEGWAWATSIVFPLAGVHGTEVPLAFVLLVY